MSGCSPVCGLSEQGLQSDDVMGRSSQAYTVVDRELSGCSNVCGLIEQGLQADDLMGRSSHAHTGVDRKVQMQL